MEHSETIGMKLWQHAKRLSQADIAYAPKHLKEQWDVASGKSIPEVMRTEMTSVSEKSAGALDFIGNLLATAHPIIHERSGVREKAREILRTHINNKRLLTFAFEAPRTMHADPVELPPEFWGEIVNWDANKIHFQSMAFIEVRILHPETAKRIRAAELPAPNHAPNVGRPTVQPQITEAFDILLEAGVIDITASMKAAFPPIQEWIKTHHPDALGDKDALSNETIRRTIAPLFKDAKNNKQ